MSTARERFRLPERWIRLLPSGVLLAALAATMVLGVLLAGVRRRDALEQWRVRLSATALDRVRALETWLAELDADAWTLARAVTHTASVHGTDAPRIGQLLREQVRGDDGGAWLLDARGRVRVAPSRSDAALSLPAVRRFAGDVLAGGATVTLVPDARGDLLVLAAARVEVADTLAALVVVESSASGYVFELLGFEPVPTHTAETLLLSRAAPSPILFSPLRHLPDVRPGTRRLSAQSPLAGLVRSAAVFGEVRDYRGRQTVAAVAHLGRAPWTLVVKVDSREAFASARRALLQFSAVAALALALLALLLRLLRTYHVTSLAHTRQESDARLRQLAAGAADTMFRIRLQPSFALEFVNAAVESLTGYSPDEWYADPQQLLAAVHRDDLRRLRRIAQERMVGPPLTLRWLHRDGSVRRIELIVIPVFGEGPVPAAIDGVARDVTERVETENALRESETRLRTLFDTTHQGVVYRDLESGTVRVNPAAREILGLEDAEGRGLNEVLFFDEHGRRLGPRDASSVQAAESGQSVGPRLLRVVNRRTARSHWILSSARPISRDGERMPYQVYTTFMDITAMREAEAELRETREMYRAVVENTTDVIARFDRDCRYLYINPSCLRYAQYSPSDLIGRTHLEVGYDEATASMWDDTIRAVFADGQPREDTFVLPGPNGQPQHFAWRLFPEYDTDGTVKTVVTWMSDITAQRSLEAQYQQAQKMEAVGRLAGGVAHDFNNLITAISGYALMVLDELPADSPAREDVAEIVRSGDRAAALTRQLLAFSRKQVLKVQVLDLGATVTGMEKMLRRLIGEDVSLEQYIEDGLWHVLADAGQVEQVIMNLSVNARDAMPEGGTLAIIVKNRPLALGSRRYDPPVPAGDYISITVADTGAGMDAVTRERLFEPFFTTKELGKGTGLGLSTVYGIVRQSGGAIRVDSEPGVGSTFEILLPRTRHVPGHAGDTIATPREPAARECILVVEDEAAVRTLTQRMLQRAGYTVLLADSGPAALALDPDTVQRVHLLLTDVVMPGMSGRELAREFRNRSPNVRVLYMSGYTDEVIASHGLLEPGVSLLQKPFTPRTLQRAVRATLEETPALW